MSEISRRNFLLTTVASGLSFSAAAQLSASSKNKLYRAGIIGRTGRGDYGHGFDAVFQGLANVTVEAIADENTTGLKAAAARSGAKRQYADYRVMLEKERLDIVAIGPRQPDCHKEMALAAIGAGAHVYLEKPMTETVADADEIVRAARSKKVMVALAHTRRCTAEFVQIKQLLAQGLIGAVRRIEIDGKQDSRAGGEDLIVLGTHDFDLLRFYFGDPVWCLASVTQDGRDIAETDAHRGREPIIVAGDTVHAVFSFPGQVQAEWHSIKTSDRWNTNFSPREKWAFVIHGTKGLLAYQSRFGFGWLNSPFVLQRPDELKWEALPVPDGWPPPPEKVHPIRNLIAAIESGTTPVCSGEDGRWAVEMVSAVYQAGLNKGRVSFPLKKRGNPFIGG